VAAPTPHAPHSAGAAPSVWETDARGENQYQSGEWYEYVGAMRGGPFGDDWLNFCHPDEREHALREWREALKAEGRRPYDLEVRIRRRDGQYRWFRVHGSPAFDAEGRVTRWVGTCTDIDDAKRARLAVAGLLEKLDERQPAKGAARARAKTLPISVYLSLLAIAALVPMVVIAAVLIYQQTASHQRELERSMLGSAQALSLALDRELAGYARPLEALAASSLIERRQFAALHQWAQAISSQGDVSFIAMFAQDGIQVFNTAIPWGVSPPQPLLRGQQPQTGEEPPERDASGIERALRTGKPANSNLFRSASLGSAIFTVSVPVVRDGKVVFVLNAGLEPRVISQLLTKHAEFPATPAFLVDGNGFLVARSSDGGSSAGLRAVLVADVLKAGAPSGTGLGVSREGLRLRFAYHRSAESGWTAVMAQEEAASDAAGMRRAAIGLALVMAGVLCALFLALLVASRIRASVGRLAVIAAGEAAPPGKASGIRELAEAEDALSRMAEARAAERREREGRLVAEIQREETAAALREKNDFLGVLAHELRNPLAAIVNSLSLVERLVGRSKRAAQAQAPLQVARRQVRQVARMVDDLLDLTRLGLGKLSLDKARFDLRQAVRDAVDTTEPTLQRRAQRLTVALPEQPIEVAGDEARLAQVFVNLLDNASKFSAEGASIEIELFRDGQYAVFKVRDYGSGIDPQFRERLFRSFAQAAAPGTRPNTGLGIGLALSKSLVERHDGSITAESAGQGRGSTFTVRLPFA
jgi:PAS domain S-box-containing protein